MEEIVRKKIQLYGIVQGIGFRPFVKRLADDCHINGYVKNKGSYVSVSAEGTKKNLADFTSRLISDAPKVSSIIQMKEEVVSALGDTEFVIIDSEFKAGDVFVSPDLALCDDCLSEMLNPNDRRYLHPFINCTNCGPRLTILESMPYDRERTTMKYFSMCDNCEAEYTDPKSRRYHAQPVCCHQDGPRLYVIGRKEIDNDAIILIRKIIRNGGIAAIKGIGGFHLCCDATNEKAVARLRTIKKRPSKPFAVMFKNILSAEKTCFISQSERECMTGVQKPILILTKRETIYVASNVAPDNPTLGSMLPYSPLHALLFEYPDDKQFPDALIMTSGNAKDEPIAKDDEEATAMLTPFCDVILSHNREILIRADDSVMRYIGDKKMLIRRSRGYAPLPVVISSASKGQVLAIGGELKNTFVLTKDQLFYPSPYIGDMGNVKSAEALISGIDRMKNLFEIEPTVVACDLHPDYQSRAIAESMELPVIYVQHHYAHILSCMAENNISEPVIGVAFDGTGYGTDGTIWGGEFLISSPEEFSRIGSIKSFKQIGGDIAVKEGYRIALALLIDLYGVSEAEKIAVRLNLCDKYTVRRTQAMMQAEISTVTSTSVGRLFDAVSALLGIKKVSTFEAEAAVSLEYASKNRFVSLAHPQLTEDTERNNRFYERQTIGGDDGHEKLFEISTEIIIRKIVESLLNGEKVDILAAAFHNYIAECIVIGSIFCKNVAKINKVALSGGVFQNVLLLNETEKRLKEEGFEVFTQKMVPANDGGIALGQAYYGTVEYNSFRLEKSSIQEINDE